MAELLKEEQSKFQTELGKLTISLNKYIKKMASNRNALNTLNQVSESVFDVKKINEYRQNKEWVKVMVDQYIEKIIVYKIHKLWNLVVVKYTNGMELWGTIKSARYKNSELYGDKHCVKYRTWLLYNKEHCFSYNRNNQLITYNGQSTFDMYKNIPSGVYDYEQLDKLLSDNNMIISFPLYSFEE